MPEHTDLDFGVFMEATERVAADPARFGRNVGQLLAGHNAPDALIVGHLPCGEHWVYAGDLATDLFGPDARYPSGNPVGKYLSRLYTLAKKGFLESVVLFPHYKRFYRILDMEKLRAEVAIKFLSRKYR